MTMTYDGVGWKTLDYPCPLLAGASPPEARTSTDETPTLLSPGREKKKKGDGRRRSTSSGLFQKSVKDGGEAFRVLEGMTS